MKKKIIIILFSLILLAICFYFFIYYKLPNQETILNYHPVSTVLHFDQFAWNGTNKVPIRKYVPLRQMSEHLRIAVIISEDDTFYRHSGINYDQFKIVVKESWQEKRLGRGASTITMQLARNAFLSRERNIVRKIREIILAKRIEETLSKSKILELYLNVIEWGPNIYGAEAASWYYFDKPASQLNLAEASLMAAIIINPNRFNLHKRFNSARKLQHRVLKLLKDAKIITSEEMEQVLAQPIVLRFD